VAGDLKRKTTHDDQVHSLFPDFNFTAADTNFFEFEPIDIKKPTPDEESADWL